MCVCVSRVRRVVSGWRGVGRFGCVSRLWFMRRVCALSGVLTETQMTARGAPTGRDRRAFSCTSQHGAHGTQKPTFVLFFNLNCHIFQLSSLPSASHVLLWHHFATVMQPPPPPPDPPFQYFAFYLINYYITLEQLTYCYSTFYEHFTVSPPPFHLSPGPPAPRPPWGALPSNLEPSLLRLRLRKEKYRTFMYLILSAIKDP